MSFNDFKLADLKKIADSFGVEVPQKITKVALINLMDEEGVTYDQYVAFNAIKEGNEDEEAITSRPKKPDIAEKAEDVILVKMTRNNMSYQVGPYIFTAEHPFIPMPVSHAQRLFDNHDGFVQAMPREVEQFYS